MQGYERLNNGKISETNTSNEEYTYPSFEQHMQELNAREKDEVVPSETEVLLQGERSDEINEHNSKTASILANNPYSPYLNYETFLKENNEKFGETFAKLNEDIYKEYDRASEESLRSSSEYWGYSSILNTYGVDKTNDTRHYYMYEDGGKVREIVTPLMINMDRNGKVANRDEFDPEALETYENLCAKTTEAYVKSNMDEQKEMQALIQLNILNNGFANHGTANATISTRNDILSYQTSIVDKLALDGNEAVIPANETTESFEEFQEKFDKVSDTYLHSKNPIKSFLAGRKYHKMRAQYNLRLKELRTINLYRTAANDLQRRLERQS